MAQKCLSGAAATLASVLNTLGSVSRNRAKTQNYLGTPFRAMAFVPMASLHAAVVASSISKF